MKIFDLVINQEAIDRLRNAVSSKDTVQGYTHNFYRYPARFSPKFVREVIQIFSKPGDVVLDPFVGGGTSLVEAIANNRHSIGFDVSPIASFVSKVKTTILTETEVKEILEWSVPVLSKRLVGYKPKMTYYDDEGYLNNLPWRIKASIEIILNEINSLSSVKAQSFVKCVVLRTAQWAIDCREKIPTATAFRKMFHQNLLAFSKGLKNLEGAITKGSNKKAPKCFSINMSSELLMNCAEIKHLPAKPKLIITSPPYVGVHMLYHQWQVNSRKRTRTPFWIIDSLDGMGSGHYTFGHYRVHGRKKYFDIAEKVFNSIHAAIDDDAIIVQLVGFSDHKKFLPKYLEMMDNAGYQEIPLLLDSLGRIRRIWRDVPNRRWYVKSKSEISSSKEVLIVHQKK
ncbi:MAG: site-specific DNA-methyltransferase [Chitinophagales bacterium]|nr:site-specific DNA-methyltransferase [Chitinophagales bacterium]